MRLYTNMKSSKYYTWWDNFYDYVSRKSPKGIDSTFNAFRETLTGELLQYNAIALDERPSFGGWVFEFDTEEDALAFVIKWG
jgi:hypothetical protein